MSLVLKEVKDGVAIIRMNNPKTMNGLDMNMTQAVYDAVTEAGADDNVKVIILAGEGKGFCGGGNLANMYEKIKDGGKFDPAESKPNMNRLAELACYMREVPKPVITVVHGAAAGAGASLAFVSDFTISTPEAKYIMAFINVGLVPDTGGMFWLVKALGYKRATELAMLGAPFTADEALKMGLINKIVPQEELWDEAMKLAKKLKNKPIDSVRFIKQMVNEIIMKDVKSALALEEKNMLACIETDNFKEGVSAFMEKRKPEFNK